MKSKQPQIGKRYRKLGSAFRERGIDLEPRID